MGSSLSLDRCGSPHRSGRCAFARTGTAEQPVVLAVAPTSTCRHKDLPTSPSGPPDSKRRPFGGGLGPRLRSALSPCLRVLKNSKPFCQAGRSECFKTREIPILGPHPGDPLTMSHFGPPDSGEQRCCNQAFNLYILSYFQIASAAHMLLTADTKGSKTPPKRSQASRVGQI